MLLTLEASHKVRLENYQRLFEAARGVRELVVIPGAHHNDVWLVGGDAYWGAWAKFLSALR